MQIHLFNAQTLQKIDEVYVESLTFSPIDMSYSVSGGSLLVRVLSEVKPTLVILFGSKCNLHFNSAVEATEFGSELRKAQAIAARRNENTLD